MRYTRTLVLSLGFLSLLGAGCSGASPAAQNIPSPGPETQLLGENLTIPSNFPQDLPRYPNALTKVAVGDAASYTLTQETTDSVAQVASALDAQLTQSGYTLSSRIGAATDAFQIVDYTNTQLKTTVRLQLAVSPQSQKTVAVIARVLMP
ncbi:hypothetical protein KBA73_04395 [Patescibacteria group bacterium]|nr:hypothetical protein [Patescibacteria group bacterium]